MQDIRERLKALIKDLYGLDFDPELTPSPDNIDADYSTNAPFKLAKELHQNPMQIAEELATGLKGLSELPNEMPALDSRESGARQREGKRRSPMAMGRPDAAREFNASISAPGFLNFTLSDEYLGDQINELSDNFGNKIASDKYKDQTVICEFSDPNPFKVLHVGHLYTSIVGDSISRLYEYAGAKVIRANFGGDVGLHVAKTVYELQKQDTKDLQIEDIAKCYIKGTAAYEDDAEARQEITKLNKEIYEINAAGKPETVPSGGIVANEATHGRVTPLQGDPGESRAGESKGGRTCPENTLATLYWKGRELSYDYFNKFYNSIGVHFDKYYPESTVAALGLKTVKEQLANGIYEMSDGAVIFNGDKYGLHTRVFINSEGVPTYEAKDVGLIFTKWQDYHFDKSIVITGNEQKDYMTVVLKSIEQYAPELTERTTHLTHGLVKLPGGVKMSSRKGNFLKAIDVLDMVKSALKREYNSNDEAVSLAATKYAFLKYKMGGNIIFDPEESVKMTGNSGPYLLYSAVRAKKILTKSGSNELQNAKRVSIRDDGREQGGERVGILISSERELVKKLLDYKSMLNEAVAEMAPHKLANYLYELAQSFSRFYENCPVIGCEDESERLKLVQVYYDTMSHGLNLLGIKIPEEM